MYIGSLGMSWPNFSLKTARSSRSLHQKTLTRISSFGISSLVPFPSLLQEQYSMGCPVAVHLRDILPAEERSNIGIMSTMSCSILLGHRACSNRAHPTEVPGYGGSRLSAHVNGFEIHRQPRITDRLCMKETDDPHNPSLRGPPAVDPDLQRITPRRATSAANRASKIGFTRQKGRENDRPDPPLPNVARTALSLSRSRSLRHSGRLSRLLEYCMEGARKAQQYQRWQHACLFW
jgi:hypothetical protein